MTTLPDQATPPILTIKDSVATLWINRPEKRNRLQPEDLREIIAHCQRIDADPSVRVVVLTANTAGQPRPVFCAGYDVGGFEGEGQDTQLFEQTVGRLHRSGQKHDVWVYVLMANKTVDEKIWAALHNKQAISEISLEALK